MHLIKKVTQILASNVVVSLSTFAIIALSPFFISVADVAKLSVVTSFSILGASILDGGLNLTSIKKFTEKKNNDLIDSVLQLKFYSFMLFILLCSIFLIVNNQDTIAISILSAAGMNYWVGLRTHEQALQKFSELARANFYFACSRFALGAISLYMQNWVLVALSLYVIPPLFVVILNFKKSNNNINFSLLFNMLSYSKFVYFSSVCFICLPYIPLYVIKYKLSDIDVATYGLALTFVSPVSLIVYSLRTLLLPKVCSGEISIYNYFFDDVKKTLVISTVFLILLIIGLSIFSYILNVIYGERYPEFSIVFFIFGLAYVLLSTIGIFNMGVHYLGTPQYELYVNILRLVCMLCVVPFLFEIKAIVTASSVILFTGEVILFATVMRYSR